ncbi:DUF1488 domain-containing protein [Caldimonas aquatica]|uniref:DUF1488 domain-containing protein n=1 Tax=Caldimonas aquatica TaxID=376175 RepID=A0ABY6MM48_9BURK|nr:DUF1488 domain-containing protein [Schlegelella aquatica]UZD53591.1 DUF1488 domain-containing protein [Schlegelella aquatica]
METATIETSVLDTPVLRFDTARSFVQEVDAVLFFARLGERTLRCYMTRAALVAYFGAEEDGGPQSCLAAFDRWVGCIHRIARRCIGQRGFPLQPVVITVDDVFRAIVAKACLR